MRVRRGRRGKLPGGIVRSCLDEGGMRWGMGKGDGWKREERRDEPISWGEASALKIEL